MTQRWRAHLEELGHEGPCCATCVFFEPIPTRKLFGNCHRNPPVIASDGQGSFPTTRSDDLCGEWQPEVMIP